MVIDPLADLVRLGSLPARAAEAMIGGGEALARQFEQWRRLGLPVQLEGADLIWRPSSEVLSADAIQSGLERAGHVVDVQVLMLTDSTNSQMLAASADGAVVPALCLAEAQSAGRGRRQRPWLGHFGQALQWSALVDSGRPVAELPGLAIVIGTALVETLHRLGWHSVGLKWPNDLITDAGKLGGILIEAVPGTLGHAVIGIGLNLQPPAMALDQPTVALATLPRPAAGEPPSRNALAVHLSAALLDAVLEFQRAGLRPFLPRFARHDRLAGRWLDFDQGGVRGEGVGEGLADDGALRVRTATGVRQLYSAEVSVRPRSPEGQ